MLVDATADHSMFSVMDGFNNYNQIRMDSSDAKKTTFWTPMHNFHYTVITFGLKKCWSNLPACYDCRLSWYAPWVPRGLCRQYSRQVKGGKSACQRLKKSLHVMSKVQIQNESLEVSIWSSLRKILRIHSPFKGINLSTAKAKAISCMEPPKMAKQLESFLGRVSYILRFISALAELLEPFKRLLMKDVAFRWAKE